MLTSFPPVFIRGLESLRLAPRGRHIATPNKLKSVVALVQDDSDTVVGSLGFVVPTQLGTKPMHFHANAGVL